MKSKCWTCDKNIFYKCEWVKMPYMPQFYDFIEVYDTDIVEEDGVKVRIHPIIKCLNYQKSQGGNDV